MIALSRVLAALALVALAAPAAGAPAPSLFPLVVGAQWVRVSDDGVEATSRVVGPKTVGTRQCMVVERKAVERGRERVTRTCYLATASEVLILEFTNPRGDVRVSNPPRPILKLPPRAGQTWSWSPADSAFELKITEKWIGEETIKVKAGTFRAWKLQTQTTGEDAEITTLTWYAPGVGVVRVERKGHRGDQQVSGWSELVSYKAK
ncbi:MAG: hypothetical protein QN178_05610 [Armatimonadota bacterium]|nr:hypothetical protein [Armatimonadota bacterium]